MSTSINLKTIHYMNQEPTTNQDQHDASQKNAEMPATEKKDEVKKN